MSTQDVIFYFTLAIIVVLSMILVKKIREGKNTPSIPINPPVNPSDPKSYMNLQKLIDMQPVSEDICDSKYKTAGLNERQVCFKNSLLSDPSKRVFPNADISNIIGVSRIALEKYQDPLTGGGLVINPPFNPCAHDTLCKNGPGIDSKTGNACCSTNVQFIQQDDNDKCSTGFEKTCKNSTSKGGCIPCTAGSYPINTIDQYKIDCFTNKPDGNLLKPSTCALCYEKTVGGPSSGALGGSSMKSNGFALKKDSTTLPPQCYDDKVTGCCVINTSTGGLGCYDKFPIKGSSLYGTKMTRQKCKDLWRGSKVELTRFFPNIACNKNKCESVNCSGIGDGGHQNLCGSSSDKKSICPRPGEGKTQCTLGSDIVDALSNKDAFPGTSIDTPNCGPCETMGSCWDIKGTDCIYCLDNQDGEVMSQNQGCRNYVKATHACDLYGKEIARPSTVESCPKIHTLSDVGWCCIDGVGNSGYAMKMSDDEPVEGLKCDTFIHGAGGCKSNCPKSVS